MLERLSAQEALDRLAFAKAAALGAGELIAREVEAGYQIHQKGPNDIVTDVDAKVERFITDALAQRFPQDRFYGEETGGDTEVSAYRRWIVDPIDGTENFSRGIPEYAVSIGFEDVPGEIAVGVVYAPAMRELFWAARGQGAYLNGKPIHVSRQTDPALAVIAEAPPFRSHELTQPYFDYIQRLFLQTCDLRNTGSAALHGCYVACGRIDGYVESSVMPYDIAASLILIQEAGGAWSSLFTPGHPFATHEIACGNPEMTRWYVNEARRQPSKA